MLECVGRKVQRFFDERVYVIEIAERVLSFLKPKVVLIRSEAEVCSGQGVPPCVWIVSMRPRSAGLGVVETENCVGLPGDDALCTSPRPRRLQVRNLWSLSVRLRREGF